MSIRAVASPADAIAYIAFCIGWGGGEIPLFADRRPRPRAYFNGDAGTRLHRLAERLDMRESAQLEIGLPEREHGLGPSQSTVLWAWLEQKDSVVRAARRFRPPPAIVLRMGLSCRRLCIWPLREVLPWALVEGANKRIAYALHAPQKYALPEALRIPLPGTFLRLGRSRPAPVLVTRLELDSYGREAVTGRLRDPPPPWIQRQRESGAWR